MKKIFFLLLLGLFVFTSCGEKEDPLVTELKSFLKQQNAPGVYLNGTAMFAYNEASHQLCTNSTTQMCRIQLDDANRALEMLLSAAPEVGKTQNLKINLYNLELPLAASYEAEVSEIDTKNHLVRLFERETLLGFVIYYE